MKLAIADLTRTGSVSNGSNGNASQVNRQFKSENGVLQTGLLGTVMSMSKSGDAQVAFDDCVGLLCEPRKSITTKVSLSSIFAVGSVLVVFHDLGTNRELKTAHESILYK